MDHPQVAFYLTKSSLKTDYKETFHQLLQVSLEDQRKEVKTEMTQFQVIESIH